VLANNGPFIATVARLRWHGPGRAPSRLRSVTKGCRQLNGLLPRAVVARDPGVKQAWLAYCCVTALAERPPSCFVALLVAERSSTALLRYGSSGQRTTAFLASMR